MIHIRADLSVHKAPQASRPRQVMEAIGIMPSPSRAA
jgi:hypothetical protein